MTSSSPASRSCPPLDGGEAGRRRIGLFATALVLAVTVTGVVLAMPSSAELDPPGLCTQNQQQGKLCLTTVKDIPDPFAYSEADSIIYRAVLTNASTSSKLSHVVLTEELTAGTVSSATSTPGACSHSGHLATCAIGSMAPGDTAVIEVVVTPPATADSGEIQNLISASFDERFSDQNGGKQDTVSYTESTTLWQAFVGAGETAQVDTDPDEQQYANTTINPSTDVLANMDLLGPDNFCVKGTVKLGKKTYVCRSGGFFELSVVDANDPSQHYRDPEFPLISELKWNGSLSSAKQTSKNFVVFYQADGSSQIQVISTSCNTDLSNLPCLMNITKLAGGGWSVELVKADNGRMR